jgi:hypothetical protein
MRCGEMETGVNFFGPFACRRGFDAEYGRREKCGKLEFTRFRWHV